MTQQLARDFAAGRLHYAAQWDMYLPWEAVRGRPESAGIIFPEADGGAGLDYLSYALVSSCRGSSMGSSLPHTLLVR
jgi:hypothetical protein